MSAEPSAERVRALYLRFSLDFGTGIWTAMQEGLDEEWIECMAWQAWAYREAANAADPLGQLSALYRDRYGPEKPALCLVVDNTRD